MKKVLVLGAGMVIKPLIRYLLNDFQVKILTRTVSDAEKVIAGHPRGKFGKLDVSTELLKLNNEIPDVDIVISLLPYIYHPMIAELCIKHKKPMVTTSYVSAKMQALDNQAKNAGVLILNEIGLDPGIDHMSAMQIIHKVQNSGGKITSFCSYCGGLLAPEANTNPWGYKFSWSPKGAVLALKNNARYLKDGEKIEISGEHLFDDYSIVKIGEFGEFEAYPNRDSIPYIEKYGISGVKTMYRGTLRNLGWCKIWRLIGKIGLLDEEEKKLEGLTYKEFVNGELETDSEVMRKFEWLGLLSEKTLPLKKGSALDVLSSRLFEKLQYEPKERDMIILHHEFLASFSERKKKITSTLVDFGIPGGDSSMSSTVGLPAAIGTKLILEGKINSKGVCIPTLPEIYEIMLKELEQQGITFNEKTQECKRSKDF